MCPEETPFLNLHKAAKEANCFSTEHRITQCGLLLPLWLNFFTLCSRDTGPQVFLSNMPDMFRAGPLYLLFPSAWQVFSQRASTAHFLTSLSSWHSITFMPGLLSWSYLTSRSSYSPFPAHNFLHNTHLHLPHDIVYFLVQYLSRWNVTSTRAGINICFIQRYSFHWLK